MSDLFLTADELRELTGFKRPSAQARWLKSHGWPFEISALGAPKVLRGVAVARLGGSPENDGPKLRLTDAAA